MAPELTKIERLNLAAKSIAARNLMGWSGFMLSWLPLMAFWEKLFQVQWVGIIVVGIAAIAPVMNWFHHRYSILVLALTDVVMAAVLVILTIPNFHPLSSHAAIYLMAFLLLWAGFDEFKKGKQHAMVQGKGWKAERVQVESWLDVLQGNPKNDRVIEIKERTFRWGDITYRFLNTGDCWVMAIFRTRKEHELPIDYTVGQPDAVTLMEGPGGILSAKVDGRVIPKRRAVAA